MKVRLVEADRWQELVLRVADPVGEEYWGGVNEGNWHGPPTGFGLNIGRDGVGDDTPVALWFDDERATVLSAGQPILLTCSLSQPACRPACGIKVKCRWDAEPMGRDYKVFVYVRRPDGKIMIQDDHEPPVPTARWSGRVEYQNTVMVPPELPPGDYPIVAGLWSPEGGDKLAATPGEGGQAAGENAWEIGVLKATVDGAKP